MTMGKLKRKEQNVSSIWKVESLGYLALKGTESDSLGTLTTNGFSIASWHQFVCTACSYLLQSVDWEGLTLKKKAAVGLIISAKSARKHNLGFYLFCCCLA